MEQTADHTPERQVLFMSELATVLGCSTRTIARRLRANALPLKPIRGIDKRPRWSRAQVDAYLSRGKAR